MYILIKSLPRQPKVPTPITILMPKKPIFLPKHLFPITILTQTYLFTASAPQSRPTTSYILYNHIPPPTSQKTARTTPHLQNARGKKRQKRESVSSTAFSYEHQPTKSNSLPQFPTDFHPSLTYQSCVTSCSVSDSQKKRQRRTFL